MPKKPTSPFGHLAFSKDGRVRRKMFRLSPEKEAQELDAIGRFVGTFNKIDSTRQITSVRQLTEAGHDFSAEISGASIEIQLTELVDRAYTFLMTEEEYKSGKWSSAVHRGSGQIPRRLDEKLRDQALTDIIAKKVEKSYARTPGLPTWLVVFSTTRYLTEYIKSGELRVSEALNRARAYLSACADLVFQEIWFTDLQTRPVQVWPAPSIST